MTSESFSRTNKTSKAEVDENVNEGPPIVVEADAIKEEPETSEPASDV